MRILMASIVTLVLCQPLFAQSKARWEALDKVQAQGQNGGPNSWGSTEESRLQVSPNRYMKSIEWFTWVPQFGRYLGCDGDDTLVTGGCETNAELIKNTVNAIDDKGFAYVNVGEYKSVSKVVWSCLANRPKRLDEMKLVTGITIRVLCEKK